MSHPQGPRSERCDDNMSRSDLVNSSAPVASTIPPITNPWSLGGVNRWQLESTTCRLYYVIVDV
eukprot:1170193-Pyramimonas_sp.AAC.1